MSKPPPVPTQNRSPKGTGEPKSESEQKKTQRHGEPKNPHQQGQQANTEQNTTHQGHQQDR